MDHEPETSRGEDGFRSRIRSRGRRRRFDTDKVLDSALLAFWRKGFSATSLDDLVVATGVKRPSLYLAFGNKERFYLQAIDRFRRWLNEETAQRLDLEAGVADVSGRIRRYIDFLIDLYVGNGRSPKGDVIICSSVADTSEHDAVRQLLVRYIEASDRVLKAFFDKAKALELIGSHADSEALSDLFNSLLVSLQQRARAGASAEDLHRISERSTAYLLAAAVSHAVPLFDAAGSSQSVQLEPSS